MAYSVLVDLTQCAGCRACVAACKQHHGLPMEEIDHVTITSKRVDSYISSDVAHHRPLLSSKTYTVVEYHDADERPDSSNWVFVKRQCMHCLHPACESACPVGAFERDEETGAVRYDGHKCMGCRYCMMACPFNVPTYEWNKAIPFVKKCTFCFDRISSDEEAPRDERRPACVTACPTRCLIFGDREDMLSEAHRRINDNPGKYIDHIYGEHEAGGTSWLYISAVPFELLGFPSQVGTVAYPHYTETALDSVPPLVVAGSAVLSGLYLLYKRKIDIAAAREKQNGGESK